MNNPSFCDIAVVSCGTLRLELNYLMQQGRLDTPRIYYSTPGLHQDVDELERQLVLQIKRAIDKTGKVVLVYGGKYCYMNNNAPNRLMKNIIDEVGEGIVGIDATHCVDMIASKEERSKIALDMAGGKPVLWMTPGWIKYRKDIFKEWQRDNQANKIKSQYKGGAIILDGIGFMDQYMKENPSAYLEFKHWMGVPIISYETSLDHFQFLLDEAATKLN